MLSNLQVCFNAVMPLFLIMGLGYGVKYLGGIRVEDVPGLNKMAFRFFMPVMLFWNLYTSTIAQAVQPKLLLFAVGATLVMYGLSLAIVLPTEKDHEKQGVKIQGMYRSNLAIIGLPLATVLVPGADMGPVAMLAAIIVPLFNVLAVITLTAFRGERLPAGRLIKMVATNPLILGSAVGLVFLGTGWRLPTALESAVHQVAAMTSPFMLFLLGAFFRFSGLRRYRRDLIEVCVVRLFLMPALLLTAALLTACGSGADTQSEEADAAVQTALPPEGITALVLSDDSQVLRFSREDETWYWQDDTTFPLDQEAMPALVEAAAAMTAASPVRVAEEDLADYGLDDTQITLAVTADGETLTFARGDQAESGDWYMRCAEDGTVRLVSDNAVKIFQLLDGSIYDMAALPVLPVITGENLLSAAVQGGENVLVNIRVVDGVRKVGSRDVTEATAALVEELGRLSVTACVDYDPAEGAAAICGLDAPDAQALVTYTNELGTESTLTLTVGLPDGSGGRYVTVNDDPTIYRMEETSLVQLLTLAETGLN